MSSAGQDGLPPRPSRHVRVRRYRQSDRDAISRLTARLAAGGLPYVVYPEDAGDPGPISERLFVATDEEEVHGAVWLKEHRFLAAGHEVLLGWPKYLVAESLLDARYSGVPRSLIAYCLREQPRLLGLGFGGNDTPMARMLALLKWTGDSVPFMFQVFRAGRALRELAPLRNTAMRRLVADTLRLTGLGQAALSVIAASRAVRAPRLPRNLQIEVVPSFGAWADELWARCANAYGFLTVRDAPMLAALFPARMPDLVRLRVRLGSADRGWALLVRHDFGVGAADKTFGRLSVGVLGDVLARPEDADAVVMAAMSWFRESQVDLVFSNQSHAAWLGALNRAGFLAGPVNFSFYRSPGAQQLIAAEAVQRLGVHVTRGDGDGPVWYPTPPVDTQLGSLA